MGGFFGGGSGGAGTPGPPDVAAINRIFDKASGTYLSSALTALTLSTVGGAANRLDFIPYSPSETVVVNQLRAEVTRAIAASLFRLGLYAAGSDNRPAERLFQSAGLSGAALAPVDAPVSPSITLTAGVLYYLAILTSSTVTFRAIPISSLCPLSTSATGTALATLWRATQTFASGLPATAPALVATSAAAPLIRLRIA